MGAGTLVELIARGKQDTYIIGNPQFSYFKSVYKRYTNFAIEAIKQIFTESPDFGKKVTCIIDKKADLLSDIMLAIELPPLQEHISWTNGIGYYMIDYVELQFGGEPIDRITGDMMNLLMELSTTTGKKQALYPMVGKMATFTTSSQTGALNLLIPLPFWFCRSIEKSLPLIAMQYTDVKIVIQFKQFDRCWYNLPNSLNGLVPANTPRIGTANLLCNYVYLDVFERTKFAKQLNHEYLIEQVQSINGYAISQNLLNANIRLFLNHPVKEIFWIYRTTVANTANDYDNYASITNYDTPIEVNIPPFTDVTLRFNGNDRFETTTETFFRLYQPYKYHSSGTNNYIYMYSFALDPENIQPSGTCNFSKIDNVVLNLDITPNIPEGIVNVYGMNYNVLRIQNGMAGILFSS
jgi:hypothetical protein